MPKTDSLNVEIIKDYCLLVGVAVKPLVLSLNKGKGVITSSLARLASSWFSPKPKSTNIGVFVWLSERSIDLLRDDELLKLEQTDKACIHGFLGVAREKHRILLALRGEGRVQVYVSDVVSIFLNILNYSSPGFSHLVVAVKTENVEADGCKADLPIQFDEDMDMRGHIQVGLTSHHIL